MTIGIDDLYKLLLAVIAGGAIGFERQFHHKSAGFRTNILICLGSTLFTMFSYKIDGTGRVAANIVTGIGFIGVGVILHDTSRVVGLTTASAVWLSAALGMGIGSGAYLLVLVAAACAVLVLTLFRGLEWHIDRARLQRSYQISWTDDLGKFDRLDELVRGCGLAVESSKRTRRESELTGSWTVHGGLDSHESLVRQLLEDRQISEFHY